MSQSNIGRAIFYSCCITVSYGVSAFIKLASTAYSDHYIHCQLDIDSNTILFISLSLGILSCLDVIEFSAKARRVLLFSCLSYFFITCYCALLKTSDVTQLNLLEAILRRELHPSIILGSEFLLILVTKTIIFSLFHSIIRTLNRLIDGRPSRRSRSAQRSQAYIYVPDSQNPRQTQSRPGIKRVKFSE